VANNDPTCYRAGVEELEGADHRLVEVGVQVNESPPPTLQPGESIRELNRPGNSGDSFT
jgi:hypothetical protein